MSRLFSYTIPIDDGSAPNPFHGMCSLAICKPGIRRVAKKGDWVAGLGSRKAPSGDLSGRIVYAMCIEEVLPMKEYDSRATSEWPRRIPNLRSADLSERLGDCIYDFSRGEPTQRGGVHGKNNIETDLSGESVLLSRRFYYWGREAIKLPDDLLAICHQTRGHRSDSNAPYFERFVNWLRSLELESGQLYGWPDYMVDWAKTADCGGCLIRKQDGQLDTPS
jgi:hypothetical protein